MLYINFLILHPKHDLTAWHLPGNTIRISSYHLLHIVMVKVNFQCDNGTRINKISEVSEITSYSAYDEFCKIWEMRKASGLHGVTFLHTQTHTHRISSSPHFASALRIKAGRTFDYRAENIVWSRGEWDIQDNNSGFWSKAVD